MADVSRDISSWMENIFRLARRLDAYEADETIHRDRPMGSGSVDAEGSRSLRASLRRKPHGR